ncbi:hypothetical protein F7Q99_32215 [Streptomyces kaniharaensis]|uniref:Glycosyl transferase family 3 domain-containing protein n=1 Tax=Streptomyces kaniharaensis TaxID=212423 RepID=A0A6N7KYV7_9ACTN|nr:hypothetical protein [Streptomyces kaniharaensis]MQS16730.1 hypothetical protein [Streptomyces kaniharaensis]
MSDVLQTLVRRDAPVDRAAWADFWDRLHGRRLRGGEALAVLASLSTRIPDTATVAAFLGSLEDRAEPLPATWPATVNPVGTGGGPATFNLTTAAVLVAAATGVRIVKTGSRGYRSRYGSIDILERLGIPTARSYAACEDHLDRFNVAFAGGFVYPVELTELARAVLPYGFKQVGRFVNLLGPFLAAVPAQRRLIGVSDHEILGPFQELALTRPVWLLHNPLGIDELVSFTENTVHTGETELTIGPGDLALTGRGTLADLRPAAVDEDPAEHLLALLGGRGPEAAVESICLNAACAALASGLRTDWVQAYRAAREAVAAGAALDLVERLRREVPAGV